MFDAKTMTKHNNSDVRPRPVMFSGTKTHMSAVHGNVTVKCTGHEDGSVLLEFNTYGGPSLGSLLFYTTTMEDTTVRTMFIAETLARAYEKRRKEEKKA